MVTNERSQNDIIVGDGIVTVIPYQFNYFTDTNIDIIATVKYPLLDPPLTIVLEEGPDYTKYSDRIELTSPLGSGLLLLVQRVVKDIQPLDYEDLRPFPEEVHEKQEDRTFMSLAEIKNMFKRVPMFSKFNEYEFVIEEPVTGNYLQFIYDPLEDKWVISNSATTVDLSNYYTKADVDNSQLLQTQALEAYADQAAQDAIDSLTAADIPVTPIANLAATEVQAALAEHQSDIDSLIAASGEVNTSSNAGTVADGDGLALPKNVYDLPFKRLKDDVTDVFDIKSFATNLALRILKGSAGDSLKTRLGPVTIGAQTYQADTSPFTGIASDDRDVLIAVYNNSSIKRSTDNGATWTTIATGGANQFTAIAYGQGVFVICGSWNGEVMYSTDKGLTWTLSSVSGGTCYADHIAFGGGRFLMVSERYDTVSYSIDLGVNFTTVAPGISPLSINTIRLIYGNGVFVMLDRQNQQLYYAKSNSSFGAAEWKVVNSNNTTNFPPSNPNDIAFGNGIFLIVNASANVYKSENLASWSNSVQSYIPGFNTGRLFFSGGYFFLMPLSGGVGDAYYSTDGTFIPTINFTTDGLNWTGWTVLNGFIIAINNGGTTGVMRIPFSAGATLVWEPSGKPCKATLFCTKMGTGSAMNFPESPVAAGANTRRLMNEIFHSGPKQLVSLNPATGQITVLETGVYDISGWSKFYRTDRCLLNLDGLNTNRYIPPNQYPQCSGHAANNTSDGETIVNYEARVFLVAGDQFYFRAFNTASGVTTETLGRTQTLSNTEKAFYAKLTLELVG